MPENGWYSLRRAFVDLAPAALTQLQLQRVSGLACTDRVVLDSLRHHGTEGVRNTVYRATPAGNRDAVVKGSPIDRILVSARLVRESARHILRGDSILDGAKLPNSNPRHDKAPDPRELEVSVYHTMNSAGAHPSTLRLSDVRSHHLS